MKKIVLAVQRDGELRSSSAVAEPRPGRIGAKDVSRKGPRKSAESMGKCG